ncbi:MAG TPA: response regulator [Thermoanaerobaculia bacterium]|nr:response regulator [Thermoanaerobaculia bacterium]
MTRILVVEDEGIVAQDIKLSLEHLGYTVAGTASSGEEAVRKAEEIRPDLVLMDIVLQAGMDGTTAAEQIHARLDIPVVYLTAYADDVVLQRAKAAVPFGYILKPFQERDLRTTIEIALHRHRLETALSESRDWLAATLRSIGDGVIATNERGGVRFMNGAAETITGWAEAEAQGVDAAAVLRLVDLEPRSSAEHPVAQALQSGAVVHLGENVRLRARNGSIVPVGDSAAAIKDTRGRLRGSVIVFRDLSERIKLERQLQEAQKMEAVGRLAGGVAHDFNNLLSAVLGFGELILERLPPGDTLRGYMEEILRAGQSAAALTRQLLAFSRKQVLEPALLDLNAVVRDTERLLRRVIGEDIELVTEAEPGILLVRADPVQLEQVLLNLAINARDAMPKGGRLTLATAECRLDEESAQAVGLPAPGPYMQLAVTDTGYGMEPATLGRIFEPFFTTKERGQGTGLGLSTAYGIVRQSGGAITAHSEPDRGTTMTIFLPRAAGTTPEPVELTAAGPLRGTETILLAEDNAPVRQLAAKVLGQYGYTVIEAESSEHALSLAQQLPEEIQLLVTDVVMPGISGGELATRIAQLRPQIKVLFMSGYTDDTIVRHGVSIEHVHYLGKPFTAARLTQKVRLALDS